LLKSRLRAALKPFSGGANLTVSRTLVFTGAHPDDESFGVGGTLAQYAAAGVKVYYICATRGEVGEVPPGMMKRFASIADLRSHELKCAAEIIGLSDVIYLGYRDSGMAGTADNQHPRALAAAPLEEVTGRLVAVFRHLRPQVVVTFDPIGGYHHPDHIAIHRATVMAFKASGDPAKYPGPDPPFQPQKLYFHVFPHKFLKIMVKILALFGRDVHHFGKNKDIDLASFVEEDYPVHAVIRLKKKSVRTREQAAACHASQLSDDSPRRGLLGLFLALFGQRDSFMRAEPPVKSRRKERDLYQGVV
jgi:LmbE family N-acetylglucosaminyl deacetylase